MKLIAYPPISTNFIFFPTYFRKSYKFPLFLFNLVFVPSFGFFFPPTWTMMHLCIMLYTYWEPLALFVLVCLPITFYPYIKSHCRKFSCKPDSSQCSRTNLLLETIDVKNALHVLGTSGSVCVSMS